MALELSDEAKVAIELYLKQINEKNEEQRQKRMTLYATIVGVFIAAFTGILIGLLAWALNNITSGTHDAAVVAAKQETQRLLETPPVLQTINSHITQANDAALKATQSAAGAHAAASEAEDSLKTLQTSLAADKEVVSAIKDLNKFVDDIVKNPEFQNGVVAKVTAQITKLESDLSTWEGNLTYEPTAPMSVKPPQTHAPDHYSTMSCPQGNFMIGMTLFTDVTESFLDRAQILCRPLIPHP
jgi:hypothetical protein